MHPVTRLGRVGQQIRSFNQLHGNELGALADEIDQAGASDIARRLRLIRDLHLQEADLVIDEVDDVASDLAGDDEAATLVEPTARAADSARAEAGGVEADRGLERPHLTSPKRAQWLAEQERIAEEMRRPRGRRDLFRRPARPGEDQ